MGLLMPNGPRRLGGDNTIMQALSPVQAAAMAAERRLRDDLWCGAPDTLGDDGPQKAKERESAKNRGGSPSAHNCVLASASVSTSAAQESSLSAVSCISSWECNTCTLLNPVSHARTERINMPKSNLGTGFRPLSIKTDLHFMKPLELICLCRAKLIYLISIK
jgi:hypothetical protein